MTDVTVDGSMCRIEMFGGLKVTIGDQVVTRFRTQKDAELLAYLACYDKQSHTREKLIDVLWPEVELEAGRNRLRQTLSSLRRTLGIDADSDWLLLADRNTIGLRLDSVAIDVATFRNLLLQSRRTTEPAAIEEALHEAAALMQHEFLNGFYAEWILLERRRLEGAYQQALLNAVSVLGKSKEYGAALTLAEQACSREPIEERIHLTVMHLHAALEDYPAVRQHFKEWERVLQEELGERPPASAQTLLWELLEPERRAAQAAEQAPSSALLSTAPSEAPPAAEATDAQVANPVVEPQQRPDLPIAPKRRTSAIPLRLRRLLIVAGLALTAAIVQASVQFYPHRIIHRTPPSNMELQAVLNYPYHVLYTNFADTGVHSLYVMSPDGYYQAKIADDAIYGSYSPDGKQIVFVGQRTGINKIWVMNSDGSNPHQITFGDYADRAPSWSPDGKQIAFGSQKEALDAMYLMNPDGSNLHLLTYGPHSTEACFLMSWSPDSKQIAYSAQSTSEDNSACYLIDVDGKHNRQITAKPSAIPCWSPDGKQIAFDIFKPKKQAGIYLLNPKDPDRSHVTRLTTGFYGEGGQMSWCPDGKHLMCAYVRNGYNQIYCISTDRSLKTPDGTDQTLTIRRLLCAWPSCSPLRNLR